MISSYKNGGPAQRSRRFAKRVAFWALVVLILVSMLSAISPDTGVAPIVLKTEKLPFAPKEFYVASVVDERADKKAVAHIIPAPAAGATTIAAPIPVDLQGGGLQAVNQFIAKGLPRNEKLRPVIITLREFEVKETPAGKGRVEGRAVVAMKFELQGDGEIIPLTEYKGGIRYNRPASQVEAVEPALRQALSGALAYFNSWIEKEAGTNPRLAKCIKVIFTDYAATAAPDTVFYSPSRPLSWNDFTGSPSKPSKYAAAVFPGFSYEGRSEVVNGELHLYLDMKVYVLQSSSWVKPDSRDDYSLNHEQKHFDLVKLVAERFKKKITPEILSVEDYNSIIQYHYIESFREMNKLQEQYDNETQHGLNKVVQEQWNKNIAEELGKL
ncbi:hypothetical protein [Pontibacter anaerobius]|uniref:DUF922 domain-containing protein n=1 Tax=Pontibacter anaerobius TaxID=2993940 RepID=A0ABT3RD24_9BACT|nr:hypothetical protein [Pontibacter anaerobius]MCX2739180.1 hypothetical protein [Pontibacter anaerobius]